MSGLFFFLFLVICGNCDGRSPPVEPREKSDIWPSFGISLCNEIVHLETKMNCTKCFEDSGSDWVQASECVAQWLPPRLAVCSKWLKAGNNGKTAKNKIMSCLRNAVAAQKREMKRAKFFYSKGNHYLSLVGDSNIIKNGPAAIFSCIAQELLVTGEEIQDQLDDDSGPCFDRFKMDPVNQKWHLERKDRPNLRTADNLVAGSQLTKSKESERSSHRGARNVVYEYGIMGHDLPFHGVGPFAVDILKGMCIFNSMEEYGDLDELVEAMIDSRVPVASWIFREVLNEITSINLPA